MLFFILQICLKTKVHITNKTKSKLELPDHPNHPKGRNPYAHVAICVKNKFQMSYKDIDDDRLDEVVQYIEFLKKNPS